MRIRVLLLVAAVAAVAGLVLSGVALLIVSQLGDDAENVGGVPRDWSLEDDRRSGDYPVYWLGESFQGLPLVDVARMDWPGAFPGKPYNDPWHEVSFAYGDCEIGPGEESCPVPLSVHVRPYCEVPPEVVADGGKVGPPEVIRGATVQRLGGGTLQMWTHNVTISIAATDGALLTAAVQNLVRLNGDGEPSSPQAALGPPDKIDYQIDCGWERVPGGPGWQRSETAD